MAWVPAVMIAVTSGGSRACRKMRTTR
jgi:hypothetical protein